MLSRTSDHGKKHGATSCCTHRDGEKTPAPVFRTAGDGVATAEEDSPGPCDTVGSVPADWSNASDGVGNATRDLRPLGDGVSSVAEDFPRPCDNVCGVPIDWTIFNDGVGNAGRDYLTTGDGVSKTLTDKSWEGFAVFRRKSRFCCAGVDCFHRGWIEAQFPPEALLLYS
ncbi:MAG: hypothetical protein NTY53_24255 [Kiritimatiellaeota bacterium]|nr:hypothetical protein [Kiritimatiellota bacterium]